MYCDWPTLGRCCFCMPLRRGVLTFGYLNLIFSALMVGVYSYSAHTDYGLIAIYHGTSLALAMPEGVCLSIYCLELIFTALLLYGTHKKLIVYIKSYYYFAITTTVATFLVQFIYIAAFISTRTALRRTFEVLPLLLAAVCIQVYLLLLIRSLLKKMEESGPQVYENQLQQIVYEGKVEANGVYDPTVVPVNV